MTVESLRARQMYYAESETSVPGLPEGTLPDRARCGMSHDVAKLLLEKAQTPLDRTKAVRAALSLGMPLNEIETYLDWLDFVRAKCKETANGQPQSE